MPELKSVVWSLVLNIANIIILFLILRALVYKPVKKFMDARRKSITDEIEAADAKLAEAEQLKEQLTAQLASSAETAEAERRRLLDMAEIHAAEITAVAEMAAIDIRSSAEANAQHVAETMMEEMQDKIADLSIEIAGRVIEREISRGDNQDIIDKYFDRVV